MVGNVSWGLVSVCGRCGTCGRLLRVGKVCCISTTQTFIWLYLEARFGRKPNDQQ